MAYLTDTVIFDEEKKKQLFREIGNNLYKIRKRKNISKVELSIMSNVAIPTVSRIENGESFGAKSLLNLIIALQADVCDVIPLKRECSASCERFMNLTDCLDSYELNCLFRIIEIYVNVAKRKK